MKKGSIRIAKANTIAYRKQITNLPAHALLLSTTYLFDPIIQSITKFLPFFGLPTFSDAINYGIRIKDSLFNAMVLSFK